MDRRKSLKSLIAGTVTGGLLVNGCTPETKQDTPDLADKSTTIGKGYGRVPKEIARDEKLMSETFFNEHEMETITRLSDMILPATDSAGGALDAGVPDFIEFIVKDIPSHQLPIRGGIMWLDHRANHLYEKTFLACNETQQIALLDEIAYPEKAKPEVGQGVSFFNHLRNLVLTGYYTTEIGIKDLGYQGNRPNIWDGVPEEVLEDHDVDYDPEWIAKCVDQSKREETAKWDDDGNLIT